MRLAVDGVPEILVTKAITARKIVSLMERIVAATFKQILRPFIFGILFADVLNALAKWEIAHPLRMRIAGEMLALSAGLMVNAPAAIRPWTSSKV